MKNFIPKLISLLGLVVFLGLSSQSFAQNDDILKEGCDDIYVVVANLPQYPGGTAALMDFISSNIKFPEEYKNKEVNKVIVLNFVVEKDGSVANIKPLRPKDPNDVFVKEAMRVVRLMPKWTPGTNKKGKPVRVSYNLPVKYKTSGK